MATRDSNGRPIDRSTMERGPAASQIENKSKEIKQHRAERKMLGQDVVRKFNMVHRPQETMASIFGKTEDFHTPKAGNIFTDKRLMISRMRNAIS